MKRDYRLEGVKFYRKSYKKARHLKSFIRFYERLLQEIGNGKITVILQLNKRSVYKNGNKK